MNLVLRLSLVLVTFATVNVVFYLQSRERMDEQKSYLVMAIVAIVLAIGFPFGWKAIVKECNGCGYSYLKLDMPDYCEKCGHALTEDAAKEFVCGCGAVYHSNSGEKFCTECGIEITYKN